MKKANRWTNKMSDDLWKACQMTRYNLRWHMENLIDGLIKRQMTYGKPIKCANKVADDLWNTYQMTKYNIRWTSLPARVSVFWAEKIVEIATIIAIFGIFPPHVVRHVILSVANIAWMSVDVCFAEHKARKYFYCLIMAIPMGEMQRSEMFWCETWLVQAEQLRV